MSALTAERPVVSQAAELTVSNKISGAGGLLFVATLVAQNAIRAKAPGFGAGPSTVVGYFVDHRMAAVLPLALFPFGLLGIVAFVAGIWTQARQGAATWWAHAGVLGVVGIVSLFGLVNVVELCLAARASALASSPAVVNALWAFHAGAFGLDLTAIAVALVALSRAARSSGLVQAWVARTALPGAACLLVASVFTVTMAEGAPWIALGVVGFVVWGIFVVVASLSLLRGSATPH